MTTIKPSNFTRSELHLITEIGNSLGLMARDEQMPPIFRELLSVQLSILQKITKSHGIIGCLTGHRNGGLDQWPDTPEEMWEAIK